MMEATMFGRLTKLTLTTLAFGGVLFVGGGGSAFADPGPIAPPGDPVALAAFNVLQNNCARCHQDGLLKGREKPADNFGNILKLDQIARDGHLIAPGNPDGSYLIKQIITGKMPDDANYNLSAPVPSDEDVAALKAWIASLGQGTGGPACRRPSSAKST